MQPGQSGTDRETASYFQIFVCLFILSFLCKPIENIAGTVFVVFNFELTKSNASSFFNRFAARSLPEIQN